jgi:hypothetical protein
LLDGKGEALDGEEGGLADSAGHHGTSRGIGDANGSKWARRVPTGEAVY